MKRKHLILAITSFVLSAVALALLFNMTNPNSGGAAGILVVLVLIYVLFFTAFIVILYLVWFIVRFIRSGSRKSVVADAKIKKLQKKSIYIAAVVALVPLFIISLNSLGQIRIWDILLIVLFEALAIFYISKRA